MSGVSTATDSSKLDIKNENAFLLDSQSCLEVSTETTNDNADLSAQIEDRDSDSLLAVTSQLSETLTQSGLPAVSSFCSCKSYAHIRRAFLNRECLEQCVSNQSIGSTGSQSTDENSTTYGGRGEPQRIPKAKVVNLVMSQKTLRLTEGDEMSEEYTSFEDLYNQFENILTPEKIDLAFEYFAHFDFDIDGFLSINELKLMLEKLKVPQTHLMTKRLVSQTLGDDEEFLTFYQSLQIYSQVDQLAKAQELSSSTTSKLAKASSIDVSLVGVSGAKRFFEAKIAHHQDKQAQGKVCGDSKEAAGKI